MHPDPAATSQTSSGRLIPDWDQLEKELNRPRQRREVPVTRKQLWRECRAAAREAGLEAFSYSHFCQLLAAGSSAPAARVAMRFDYEPGVWGMADFSGKTLRLRRPDGSEKPVEIFVACLCFSRIVYAEAVSDQSARNWCMAHRRAFEYFGGVPARRQADDVPGNIIRLEAERASIPRDLNALTETKIAQEKKSFLARNAAMGNPAANFLSAGQHETGTAMHPQNGSLRHREQSPAGEGQVVPQRDCRLETYRHVANR